MKKYIAVICLSLTLGGCYVAPYDPYYAAPVYGGYYRPAYYVAPAPVVSVGYGGGYYRGHGYGGGYHRGGGGHRGWR